MEKIEFTLDDGSTAFFYVVEKTRVNGIDYILVTDTEEDEADAYILKDTSGPDEEEALYEVVDDEEELEYVSKILEQILDDVDIEL